MTQCIHADLQAGKLLFVSSTSYLHLYSGAWLEVLSLVSEISRFRQAGLLPFPQCISTLVKS